MPRGFLDLPPEIRIQIYYSLVEHEPYRSPRQIVVDEWKGRDPSTDVPGASTTEEPGSSAAPIDLDQAITNGEGALLIAPFLVVNLPAHYSGNGWGPLPDGSTPPHDPHAAQMAAATNWYYDQLDEQTRNRIKNRWKLPENITIPIHPRAYHTTKFLTNLPALRYVLDFRLTCRQIHNEFTFVCDQSLPYPSLSDLYNALRCMGDARRQQLTHVSVVYRHEERHPIDYSHGRLHETQKVWRLVRRCKGVRHVNVFMSEVFVKRQLSFGPEMGLRNLVHASDDAACQRIPLKYCWGWSQLANLRGLNNFELVSLEGRAWSAAMLQEIGWMKARMEKRKVTTLTDEQIRLFRSEFDAWWRGDEKPRPRRRPNTLKVSSSRQSKHKVRKRQQSLSASSENPLGKYARLPRHSNGLSSEGIKAMIADGSVFDVLGPKRYLCFMAFGEAVDRAYADEADMLLRAAREREAEAEAEAQAEQEGEKEEEKEEEKEGSKPRVPVRRRRRIKRMNPAARRDAAARRERGRPADAVAAAATKVAHGHGHGHGHDAESEEDEDDDSI